MCDDGIAACDFAPVTACPAAQVKAEERDTMNPCIRR